LSQFVFVIPTLAFAGPVALALIMARSFPHAARAVMVLLAGVVAIVTRDHERRVACLAVLDKVTRRDSGPPVRPRRRAIRRRR